MVVFSTEPDQLPSLRVVVEGELAIVTAAPSEIKQMFADDATPTVTEMLKFLKTMTQEKVAECHTKQCTMHYGVARKGDVFVLRKQI